MKIELTVNDIKSSLFLQLLDIYKKDKYITDYKIIEPYTKKEQEILDELSYFKDALNNAKKGIGNKSDKFIEII